MRIIVGLGNPGERYRNNRHNVGFQFIDYFIGQYQISKIKNQNDKSKIKKKEMLHVTCYMLHDLILAKPQTFMNQSGLAVRKIIRNWKLEIGNLIVVHDDLDIPLGKFKIQKGVGPKLHYGIQSIEKELGRSDFWRVRIGVDNRQKTGLVDGETYVLQDFTMGETEVTKKVFEKIIKSLFKLIS